MTPPNPLTELADRVQALTCACRETDLAIGEALGVADHSGPAYHRPFKDFAKHYTASLDAAMTLARTPQEAYQATQDAVSAIAKRDDLHCAFYRGSIVDDLARQVSAILIRARAASESSRG